MNSQKKNYLNLKLQFDENLSVIWQKESDYRESLKRKFSRIVEQVKDEFRIYCSSHNFQLIQKTSFMEAKFGEHLLLIRIDFPDILVSEYYSFQLSIVEDTRREFIIYIIPEIEDVYIPRFSKIHYTPKDSLQLKNSIKNLEKEFIFLDEKQKEFEYARFYFCSRDSHSNPKEITNLERFNNFITILNQRLSN
jgi:hypothetical protein